MILLIIAVPLVHRLIAVLFRVGRCLFCMSLALGSHLGGVFAFGFVLAFLYYGNYYQDAVMISGKIVFILSEWTSSVD